MNESIKRKIESIRIAANKCTNGNRYVIDDNEGMETCYRPMWCVRNDAYDSSDEDAQPFEAAINYGYKDDAEYIALTCPSTMIEIINYILTLTAPMEAETAILANKLNFEKYVAALAEKDAEISEQIKLKMEAIGLYGLAEQKITQIQSTIAEKDAEIYKLDTCIKQSEIHHGVIRRKLKEKITQLENDLRVAVEHIKALTNLWAVQGSMSNKVNDTKKSADIFMKQLSTAKEGGE